MSTIITLDKCFGEFTSKHLFRNDDYALAIDPASGVYAPSIVSKRIDDDVYVKYMDGRM